MPPAPTTPTRIIGHHISRCERLLCNATLPESVLLVVKALLLFPLLLLGGCHVVTKFSAGDGSPIDVPLTKVQKKIVSAARDQLSWGTKYDPAYIKLPYPKGDVPKSKGVCTDVVVRALRGAGYDLQKLIHEDMTNRWKEYPRYSSNKAPDTNIDHRRVPNQIVYFKRFGDELTKAFAHPEDWNPGDIVMWKLPGGADHVGVLSDKRNADGYPLVIHNIGPAPSEDDVLTSITWKVTGHFRFPPQS